VSHGSPELCVVVHSPELVPVVPVVPVFPVVPVVPVVVAAGAPMQHVIGSQQPASAHHTGIGTAAHPAAAEELWVAQHGFTPPPVVPPAPLGTQVQFMVGSHPSPMLVHPLQSHEPVVPLVPLGTQEQLFA
jgi:hypothetical protein